MREKEILYKTSPGKRVFYLFIYVIRRVYARYEARQTLQEPVIKHERDDTFLEN